MRYTTECLVDMTNADNFLGLECRFFKITFTLWIVYTPGFPQVLESPKIWKASWKVLGFLDFYE